EATHLIGIVDMWQGAPLKAYATLSSGAAAAETVDRAKAARMLADAVWAACMAGEIDNGLDAGRRACVVASGSDEVTTTLAESALGLALLLRGHAREAMPYLKRYQSLLEEGGAEVRALHALRPAGQVLTWLELHDRAREIFLEMIERARVESALG